MHTCNYRVFVAARVAGKAHVCFVHSCKVMTQWSQFQFLTSHDSLGFTATFCRATRTASPTFFRISRGWNRQFPINGISGSSWQGHVLQGHHNCWPSVGQLPTAFVPILPIFTSFFLIPLDLRETAYSALRPDTAGPVSDFMPSQPPYKLADRQIGTW